MICSLAGTLPKTAMGMRRNCLVGALPYTLHDTIIPLVWAGRYRYERHPPPPLTLKAHRRQHMCKQIPGVRGAWRVDLHH